MTANSEHLNLKRCGDLAPARSETIGWWTGRATLQREELDDDKSALRAGGAA
jgi:hypothetical protein